MKKRYKTLMTIVGALTAFLVYVQITYRQKFDVPETGIRGSADSAIVARGKYLVLGQSHCYACHTNDSLRRLNLKEPLMGGNVYKTPFGNFNMPNLTMDETGIRHKTDEQLARAIRFNVNHKGEAMPGFMSYNEMSDEDICAIISYMRTTTPVKNAVPEKELNILGKIVTRFLAKPKLNGKISTLKPDTSALYGKYLAITTAQCNSCHTRRNKLGAFVGEPFAGGFKWDLEESIYLSPNLTPDDSTGRIASWSEEIFRHRFRVGRVLPDSPMPWEAYQDMTDNDLRALYKFFRSLTPVRNSITYTHMAKERK